MKKERPGKVSIEQYKKECEIWLREHNKYLDDLAAINVAENKEVDAMPASIHHDRWDLYCEKHFDKVQAAEQARQDLKKKYGDYSSFYACPYYCVITNVDELEKVVPKTENNYRYWKKDLKDWSGKMVQSHYRKGHWGKFIGLAFFLDDVYFLYRNPKTKEEFIDLSIEAYNKWDHRDWRIVENGKDYL